MIKVLFCWWLLFASGIFLFSSFARVGETPKSLTSICVIQGTGDTSRYAGKNLTTRGVVYADQDDGSARGFYLQQQDCNSKLETSDGIFVYLDERVDRVDVGDRVEVGGKVEEYYGMTEILADSVDVKVLATGQPLPEPVLISPPFDNEEAREYLEAREAMFVEIIDAIAVGPTDASGWSWIVDANLGVNRVFQDDPRGTGEIVCIGDGGSYQLDPQVKVGDGISGLRGALDYEVGSFCIQLFAPAQVNPALQERVVQNNDRKPQAPSTPDIIEFRLTTFNLANLFDTIDDPQTEDTVLSAAEYQRRLQKRALTLHDALDEPEMIAVQEVENETVIKALVARPELLHEYGYVWDNGPDLRGLDVALLFRKDRLQILDHQVYQGCTDLVDGLGPDGNGDVKNPVNTLTCDRNGDGKNDGNRLFSRPPLVVRAWVCPADCQIDSAPGEGLEMRLVINHFKSKIEDSQSTEYTLPRRIEQAEFVANLVTQFRQESPSGNVVVAGDLNDFPDSQPLSILEQAGLRDANLGITYPERYTYIFQGISQVLDYALFDLALPLACIVAEPAHINADYPAAYAGVNETVFRSSDHDPVTFWLKELKDQSYLPVVQR